MSPPISAETPLSTGESLAVDTCCQSGSFRLPSTITGKIIGFAPSARQKLKVATAAIQRCIGYTSELCCFKGLFRDVNTCRRRPKPAAKYRCCSVGLMEKLPLISDPQKRRLRALFLSVPSRLPFQEQDWVHEVTRLWHRKIC